MSLKIKCVTVVPGGTSGIELPASAGDVRDVGPTPGSERSLGGGNGNPLWYSCLGNPWTEEPGRLQTMRLQRVSHTKRLGIAQHSTAINSSGNNIYIII